MFLYYGIIVVLREFLNLFYLDKYQLKKKHI